MPTPSFVASKFRVPRPLPFSTPTPSIGAASPRLPTLSALGPFRHARAATSTSTCTTPPTVPLRRNIAARHQQQQHLLHTSSPRPTAQNGRIVNMADRVHRVTMFKLPIKEQQEKLIAAYKVLSGEQQRDGKPYILSLVTGPALDDPRSKGFTLVAKTEFSSLDDMRWYDADCPAHNRLKGLVREFGIGPDDILSIYFQPGHVAVI